MGNNERTSHRIKPKTPPPPRVDKCACGGTLGLVCKCAGTGVKTDYIDDADLTNIKNGNKHHKR